MRRRVRAATMSRVLAAVTVSVLGPCAVDASAQSNATRAASDQRFQISQMERVLEGAVEYGASITRDRLQAVLPPAEILSANARARGYRLDGYGVFFHVEVPTLQGTLPWSFRILDQNNLGLDSALRDLRTAIERLNDVNLDQAWKRIELQVLPFAPVGTSPPPSVRSGPRDLATGTGVTSIQVDPSPDQARDPILNDPEQVYRDEVRTALMDAMLEHSRGLNLASGEVLTVAARGSDDGRVLGSAEPSRRVTQITVRGMDLVAFLAGQISHEEARRRIEVRVF